MRLAAVLVFAAGCAASQQQVRVAFQLQGAAAGPAEQKRCIDAATRAGAIVDAHAPVQAVVTLEPTGGRLQVLSSRGLVRDESKPAGSVEALCTDAALAAGTTTRESPPAADWNGTPANEQPVRGPSTSGGDYRGPISN